MRSFRNSWASCWLWPQSRVWAAHPHPVPRHYPHPPPSQSRFLGKEHPKAQDNAARVLAQPKEDPRTLQLSHLYPEKEGTYFWKTARNRVGFTASQESGCHRAPITSAKAVGAGAGDQGERLEEAARGGSEGGKPLLGKQVAGHTDTRPDLMAGAAMTGRWTQKEGRGPESREQGWLPYLQ